MRRGDLARAAELVTESNRIHGRTGDRWGQAQAVGTLGAIERDSGNEERAYELIAVSLTMAREAGVRWWESGLLAELAMLSLRAGRSDEAETQARESLALAEEIGDRAGRVLGVGLFSALAAVHGQPERAQALWAAVAEEDGGAPLGGWRRHREDVETAIREQLGAAWCRPDPASPLSLDDAVALAVQPRA